MGVNKKTHSLIQYCFKIYINKWMKLNQDKNKLQTLKQILKSTTLNLTKKLIFFKKDFSAYKMIPSFYGIQLNILVSSLINKV